MSTAELRPFRRSDRAQLTELVNAHVAAVLPGYSVSVNTVLSQLEGEPGEFITDPWVAERATLVAEQHGRIAAAAHLRRYGGAPGIGPDLRDTAEIAWLLFWPLAPSDPPNPHWPDGHRAADALASACLRLLDGWCPAGRSADGDLPAPAMAGIPEQWPHIRELLGRHGFVPGGRTETVLIADVADLPRPTDGPEPEDLVVHRSLGINGTRLTAVRSGEPIGYIELDTTLADGNRAAGSGGWADIGNLEAHRADPDDAVLHHLLVHAAQWLRLARTTRLLAYAGPEDEPARTAFLTRHGFAELTRTERVWRPARQSVEKLRNPAVELHDGAPDRHHCDCLTGQVPERTFSPDAPSYQVGPAR
jgi:hypothetical protein